MFPRWLRRFGFWLAFRGCKISHPDCVDYVQDNKAGGSIEAELRIEHGLELHYWARSLRS